MIIKSNNVKLIIFIFIMFAFTYAQDKTQKIENPDIIGQPLLKVEVKDGKIVNVQPVDEIDLNNNDTTVQADKINIVTKEAIGTISNTEGSDETAVQTDMIDIVTKEAIGTIDNSETNSDTKSSIE